MLTLPKVVDREAQPYVAMRRVTPIPFDAVIAETLPRLFAWVKSHDIVPAGPPFFKYNLIDMEHGLEIDFGLPTTGGVVADAETVTGVLPAGRYASLIYYGRYEDLREVTAVLLGWAQFHGHQLEVVRTPKGDRFASRLEIYVNGPDDVSSPEELETVLAFKLADG